MFDKVAKTNGLDPLVPEAWYTLVKDKKNLKVFYTTYNIFIKTCNKAGNIGIIAHNHKILQWECRNCFNAILPLHWH